MLTNVGQGARASQRSATASAWSSATPASRSWICKRAGRANQEPSRSLAAVAVRPSPSADSKRRDDARTASLIVATKSRTRCELCAGSWWCGAAGFCGKSRRKTLCVCSSSPDKIRREMISCHRIGREELQSERPEGGPTAAASEQNGSSKARKKNQASHRRCFEVVPFRYTCSEAHYKIPPSNIQHHHVQPRPSHPARCPMHGSTERLFGTGALLRWHTEVAETHEESPAHEVPHGPRSQQLGGRRKRERRPIELKAHTQTVVDVGG